MRSKRSAKTNNAAPASPIDAKKRELAEKEARLKADLARNQKLLEEAPRLMEEQQRRKREAFVRHMSRTEARFGDRGAKLHDPRFPYELNVSAAAKQKVLRKDRKQGMLTFFVLLLILVAVICWVYYTVLRGG